MKKFMKVSLIVAGILFAAGLVITIAGTVLGGTLSEAYRLADESNWPFWSRRIESYVHRGGPDASYDPEAAPDTEAALAGEEAYDGDSVSDGEAMRGTYVQGIYDVSEVTSLEAEMTFGELTVEMSPDIDRIRVETDNINSNFKCKIDGSTLEVEFKKNNPTSWLNGESTPYIYILIPEGMHFDKTELSVDAGNVHASEIHTNKLSVDVDAGEFSGSDFYVDTKTELEVDAGQISVTNLNTDTLEADCDLGSIDFSGSVTGNAKVKAGAGQVNLNFEQSYSDFDYVLKCGLGNIELNGESIGSIDAKRTIDNGAAQTLTADCGMGEINITLYD